MSACLRIRGLPFSASESDVRSFFENFNLEEVYLLSDFTGKSKGEGFVRLSSAEEASQAQFALNRKNLGRRYVEIFPADAADMESSVVAERRVQLDTPFIRIRGFSFPKEATPDAARAYVTSFLAQPPANLSIPPSQVQLVCFEGGICSGEAIVRLPSPSLAPSALKLHRSPLPRMRGHHRSPSTPPRLADVFQITDSEQEVLVAEMAKIPAKRPPSHNLLRLRGLPFSTTEADVGNFLAGFSIKEGGIHLVATSEGRLTGDALVEFGTAADSSAALLRHGTRLGHRFIEVLALTQGELKTATSFLPDPAAEQDISPVSSCSDLSASYSV